MIFRLCVVVYFLYNVSRAQQLDTNLWITNGTINVSYIKGSKLYIGGSFDDVGPCVGHGVYTDTANGILISDFHKIQGNVYCALADSNGGLFVGGDFKKIGLTTIHGFAHFLPNGSLDTLYRFNVTGSVYCMAFTDSGIVVGGEFIMVNNDLRNNAFEIAFDSTGGVSVPIGLTNWSPNTDSAIYAIAYDVTSDIIYLGGKFKSANGVLRENLARVDHILGYVLSYPSFPYIDFNFRTDGAVRALALDTNTNAIYIAGDFNSINTTNQRKHLAKFSLLQNGAFTSWTHHADYPVKCLVLKDTLLLIGGNFTTIDNLPKKHIAAFNLNTNTFINWLPNIDGVVNSIFVSDSIVYVGGKFNFINTVERKNSGAISFPTNQLLGFNPHVNNQVFSVLNNNGMCFMGGVFTSINGVTRNNFAQLNLMTGAATSLNLSFNGPIYIFQHKADSLFVGGGFTLVNNIDKRGLCALNSQSDFLLPFYLNVQGYVKTISFENDKMYLGGYFNAVNHATRNNLACYNIQTDSLTNWNPNANGTVNKIVATSNLVYAAGYFSTINGYIRKKLVAINPISAYPNTWQPNPDDGVYDILLMNNKLLAAGFYQTVASVYTPFYSEIDLSTASVLVNNTVFNNVLSKLFYTNDTLIASGYFTQPNSGISILNSSLVPYQTNVQVDAPVSDFFYDRNYLFVAGSFQNASQMYHPNTALYLFNSPAGFSDLSDKKFDVNVFPNPCTDYLCVSSNSDVIHSITLYDISGKEILETISSSNEKYITIPIKTLSAGYCIVKVNTHTNGYVCKKIVVIK